MTNELTNTWIITELSSIQTKKMQYKSRLAELKWELEESELMKQIRLWEQMIKELELEEIEMQNKWIQLLQSSWIDKFEANGVEIRLKTSPWSIKYSKEIEDTIPDEYKKSKTTFTIDKTALKKDILEWLIIDWVSIEKTVSLEIKYK